MRVEPRNGQFGVSRGADIVCFLLRTRKSTECGREMIVSGQILVPFNSHLRVKDIISVLEEAAKPGMRVVFLVRYP